MGSTDAGNQAGIANLFVSGHPLVRLPNELAEAAAAHARMETSAHIGKIVLTVAA